MVRDLDADARMTIVMRDIGGALRNSILLFLKLGSRDGIALANAPYVKRYSGAELGAMENSGPERGMLQVDPHLAIAHIAPRHSRLQMAEAAQSEPGPSEWKPV
jgi:hypothetical protein